jgi:pimeloyl-ACP methyl ester carboxylesterase
MTGGGLRLLERSGPGVMYVAMKACNDYRDGLESAKKIACPALLVLGDRDAMTPPKVAKSLAEAIPGSETVVLKGCGHMMMAEQPDQVLDALIAHL